MKFTKMHGTGNDFVMIDNWDKSISLSPQEVQTICNRNLGIGADGVILVEPGQNSSDAFMNYINADGSLAEMCGNGTRCIADYMARFKNFDKETLLLDTRGGIKRIEIQPQNQYKVNMGIAQTEHSDFPQKPQKIENHLWYFASMGNPHAVGFFDSEEELNKAFDSMGHIIEASTQFFPNKINVNFVTQKDKDHFLVKTYERGAGPTLACGTGASACFYWIQALHLSSPKTKIEVPGGNLFFEFNDQKEILMTGPSDVSFEGFYPSKIL